jgi:hypothetical protein
MRSNRQLQAKAGRQGIRHSPKWLSGCTKFPESRSFVFNLFPGFNCIIAALKSRIIAFKSRSLIASLSMALLSIKQQLMVICPYFHCLNRRVHSTPKLMLKFVRDISTRMTLTFLRASVSVRGLSTTSRLIPGFECRKTPLQNIFRDLSTT